MNAPVIPARHAFICFASGRDADWEAICLDLDIAVQGRSFEDVQASLSQAIMTYLASLDGESPAVRDALLKRRAPLRVYARHLGSFVWFALRHALGFGGVGSGRAETGFIAPCRA